MTSNAARADFSLDKIRNVGYPYSFHRNRRDRPSGQARRLRLFEMFRRSQPTHQLGGGPNFLALIALVEDGSAYAVIAGVVPAIHAPARRSIIGPDNQLKINALY